MLITLTFYYRKQQQSDNHLTADDIKKAGVLLTAADFDAALNEARASYSDSIGAPKVCVVLSLRKNLLSDQP